MRYPQLIVLESDGWLGKQLAELASEARWLVKAPKKPAAALALAREGRPTVLVVQVELADESAEAFALIADIHRLCPDAAVVAVSDVKVSDADRAAWTALLFDLGARYVLFPPLLKSVLEDVVSGLMAVSIRKVVGDDPSTAPMPQAPGGARASNDPTPREFKR